MRPLLTISLFFGIVLMGSPRLTRAQTFLPSDPIQYNVSPESPGPNQPVHIEAQSFDSSLQTATFTWKQNGRVVSSGVGNNTFDFVTGNLGSQTLVLLTISSPSLGISTRSFSFSPSAVNLVWEADTSSPSFYEGKTLYSAGSSATVSSFPQIPYKGGIISTNALSFQWKLNNILIADQSGIGRNTLRFQGDQLKSAEIVELNIYVGNSKVGSGTVTIPADKPQVYFYDKDPLRGEILDTAFSGSVNLLGKEFTIQAEPYNFSNTSKYNGALLYTWSLNGSNVTGPDADKGILTLRENGVGAGSSAITVAVQNSQSDQLVQSADASIQIILGQVNSITSLFGL